MRKFFLPSFLSSLSLSPPPIHSLIYSLIYELLIYALREKLTVVQSSVRAAAALTIDDHHRGTGMSHAHTHTYRNTWHRALSQRESEDRCCISIAAEITVHQFCAGSTKLWFGFNCDIQAWALPTITLTVWERCATCLMWGKINWINCFSDADLLKSANNVFNITLKDE